MMKTETPMGHGLPSILLASALALSACGPDGGNDNPDATPTPMGTPVESLYIVPAQIYSADFSTSTSYLPMVQSLDVASIPLTDAQEVNGRATVARVEDWLFVASSADPTLDRYDILEDGTLLYSGSLSFQNYALDYFALDDWGNVIINPTKAYMFNPADGSHIIWNPTTLEIEREIDGPDIVERGYRITSSTAAIRGNRLYRTFSYVNYLTWDFPAAPQYLAVYDIDTDSLLSLEEETRCPQLYSRPFMDDDGHLYFSGWNWTVGETLVNDYPDNCSLRIPADTDAFDPDWQLNYAADVTGGREAAILRYLGDGQAILDVFHDDRATLSDDMSSQDVVYTPNWRLWQVDLETRAGAPIEGIGYKSAGYSDTTVDGRTLIMLANEDYSETTAYEIEDGIAYPVFAIEGSAYHIVKIK